MTSRLAWIKGRMTRLLTMAVIASVVSMPACNRAQPEKSEKKDADAGQTAQPPGVLADKQNATGQPILPPDGKSIAAGSDTASGANAADVQSGSNSSSIKVDGPPPPGVQIENVTSLSPNADEDAKAAEMDARWGDRMFMKLELPNAALAPDQLLMFLMDCDRAVQDLAITRQSNQLSEKLFLEQAKRLSGIKLEASERLFADKNATVAQKKTAMAAQVESLSQLSGLGDVQAAQKLLKIAGDLAKSSDAQLAHQGRLVLMGFRLNQLGEGQIKDPKVIVDDVNSLLDNSTHRGMVELLAIQQSLGVLTQLGYADEARQVRDRIIKEFQNSPEKDVAMRSWMVEVSNSPELLAVNEAIQNTLAGNEKDPTKVATLAASFVKAFPSLNTAASFLQVIVDLEYTGHVDAARELKAVIAKLKTELPKGPRLAEIDSALDGHTRRMGALGQPLILDQLTGMDGAPFDWSVYRNKVVLVFFWASWERPSWELIEKVKALRERIPDTNFEIVGICTDDGRTITNAEQMVSLPGMKWRNLRSSNAQAVGLESAAAKQLGVNAYSHFELLVDKKGNVRAVHPNFDNIDAMIEQLLKE